jgi:hypothetical protein
MRAGATPAGLSAGRPGPSANCMRKGVRVRTRKSAARTPARDVDRHDRNVRTHGPGAGSAS